jgi:formamidopyrimidine-DNA glycosylase
MFELPECQILAKQMTESLKGKIIQHGSLGNSPHKFVWYNREPDEFVSLISGKQIGHPYARGRWLFIPLNPGYVLLIGECGGKFILNPSTAKLPKKYHLHIQFTDGSFVTARTQMWGAYELYEQGKELERQYVQGMRTTPIDPEFTLEYLNALIDACVAEKRRSVKGLLTQDQLIPGLGNAIAQDIQFKARLDPRCPLDSLDPSQREHLYQAIINTVAEVIERGGRYDEYDLYGHRGSYVRIMDKNALDNPCPVCDGEVKKIQYLGGACYFCPSCQVR